MNDANTIAFHHSLQRESKQTNNEFNTDTLIDYPTTISAQSSNKIKPKKSVQLESQTSNSSSGHSSLVKPEKIEQIYGMRNNKAKRGVASHKSSSMKAADHGIEINRQNLGKISFEEYIYKSKHNQEVSLPYIQSTSSGNPQV